MMLLWLSCAWQLTRSDAAQATEPTDDRSSPRSDRETCANAYEGTQLHEREDKLLLARSEAETCVMSCPHEVANDCRKWLDQLEHALPRVVVSVRDAAGHPIVDAEAHARPSGVALSLEGGSTALDPGHHELEVSRGDHTVTQRVHLKRGERAVRIEFVLPSEHPAPEPVKSAAQPFPSTLEWIGLGLGVAAVGTMIAGQLHATSLRNSCAPNCADSDRAVVEGLFWTAGGLGVAGVTTFGIGYAGRF
jgi:hypothetical protein